MAMGRPISFWFRNDLIDRVDEAAKNTRTTRSGWVRAAIWKSLAQPKEEEKPVDQVK